MILPFICLVLVQIASVVTAEHEREHLEPYMRNIFRLVGTTQDVTRIVSTAYSYKAKSDSQFGLIFDDLLGAVVHAGYRTRHNYLLKSRICPNLKKLYEYQTPDGRYKLTLDFLEVNNKGDRQPIGFCASKPGYCGANIPLREYQIIKKGTPAFYYGTSEDNSLGLSLEAKRVVCYIFERSGQEVLSEGALDLKTTFHVGSLYDKLVKIYAVYNSDYTYYYPESSSSSVNATTHANSHLAFNLLKPEAFDFIQFYCKLRPITQLQHIKDGKTVLVDDPVKELKLLAEGYEKHHDNYLLGYGLQKRNHCGSRVKYRIMTRSDSEDVRAVREGFEGRYNQVFKDGFIYSL